MYLQSHPPVLSGHELYGYQYQLRSTGDKITALRIDALLRRTSGALCTNWSPTSALVLRKSQDGCYNRAALAARDWRFRTPLFIRESPRASSNAPCGGVQRAQ